MVFSRIHAVSSYLPERSITNKDLEKTLDTSDEWILKRTGISSRHILADDESSLSMAVSACQSLITTNQLDPRSISSVIVATSTPHTMMPSVACQLCNHFDISNAFAMDINAACSGFLYALEIAHSRLQSSQEESILVVGVDSMSRIIDWKDRQTAILFGDGAGCVLLKPSKSRGIFAINCKSEACGADYLQVTGNPYGQIPCHLSMQGKEVFRYAVERLSSSSKNLLTQHKIDISSIDWVVPHQANIRILQQVAKKISIAPEKLITTVNTHANTSAASIPLALHVAVTDGRIQSGDRLLLQAFGAGFTWGSAICDF